MTHELYKAHQQAMSDFADTLLKKLNLEYEIFDWTVVHAPSKILLPLNLENAPEPSKTDFIAHRHTPDKWWKIHTSIIDGEIHTSTTDEPYPYTPEQHARLFLPSPKPTTRPDIDTILARVNATTGGTWTEEIDIDYGNHDIVSDTRADAPVCRSGAWGYEEDGHNMTFFLHAKNDVLDLVKYAQELEAQNTELQARADRLEYLAIQAHGEEFHTEGQLVWALGIPRLKIRGHMAAMREVQSDAALEARKARYQSGMNSVDMMLEEYKTARDALKGWEDHA